MTYPDPLRAARSDPLRVNPLDRRATRDAARDAIDHVMETWWSNPINRTSIPTDLVITAVLDAIEPLVRPPDPAGYVAADDGQVRAPFPERVQLGWVRPNLTDARRVAELHSATVYGLVPVPADQPDGCRHCGHGR